MPQKLPELDPQTLACARQGDPAAMRRFIEWYTPLMTHVVGCLLRPRGMQHEVEDVVIDVQLDSTQALCDGKFDPGQPSPPSALVTAIARARAVDRLRARGHEPTADDPLELDDLPAATSPQDVLLQHAQQRKLLQEKVAQLSKDDQELVYSWLKDELAPKEIAERRGISVRTVRVQLFRALLRLRMLFSVARR